MSSLQMPLAFGPREIIVLGNRPVPEEALSASECLALALRRVAGRGAPGAARLLLERFGSLLQVFGASEMELRQVVSAPVAAEIGLLHRLQVRTLREPVQARPVISSSSSLRAYLRQAIGGAPREQFRVLFLDKRNRLIRG
jgi:DNA repair protein RadC